MLIPVRRPSRVHFMCKLRGGVSDITVQIAMAVNQEPSSPALRVNKNILYSIYLGDWNRCHSRDSLNYILNRRYSTSTEKLFESKKFNEVMRNGQKLITPKFIYLM
jgi:hypothetical protein